MSTYNFHGNINGPANMGDQVRIDITHGLNLEGVIRLSEGLLDALRAEYPGLVGHGEIIRGALAESEADGGPPNRGRIRSALETISIGASAGSGSLAFVQQFMHVMGL
ncbi:hypothetical protein J2Z21_000997 [Streptomyces griseochromogenes]|uniref:Uncharacterized protein n=1 Tax=Streptomyces griseochromogenes TaxID=68214 RepID=A0A1B1AUL1_9ACTN|nr:hypothetical protein [Streptomyces griseochromogenes]ANP50269.1 hypothetical protein AVL59_12155 [Streptomyces griseochromogenes]MBP2048073.1 hypothetical protein [Streptomyces griseochromogenes]